MSFYSFLAAALVILATPGPTNTILAACGATLGLKRARHLPFAEAAGYFLAVSAYLVLAQRVAHFPVALPVLKGVASAWLLFVAWRLWQRPVKTPTSGGHGSAFMRIFLTTILNPKAMLVGAILVPSMPASIQIQATLAFVCLSFLVGSVWTAGGSIVPDRFRHHANRTAAVVVGSFSVMAASSLVTG
jgi:threonine/homoserine/homoserine lactone efflux protein